MNTARTLRTFDNLRALRSLAKPRPVNYSEMEDNDLLEACLKGNARAMAAFVQRFERYIRHMVGRTVHRYTSGVDSSTIDDLCQEVFMALFENDRRRLKMFEGRNGCPLRAWIRVIAVRTVISRMRRWKKHSQLPNEDSDRGSVRMVDDGPDALDMLSAQDDQKRKAQLLRLAETLSAEDRQLIEMIYVHEMSVPAITEQLHIRRGALYMRKNRALTRLRARARAAGLITETAF
jgi:RNA polymerase sigma-70 factor (ECF subfamily)